MNVRKILCTALAVLTLLPAALISAAAEDTPRLIMANPAADYAVAMKELQNLHILKGNENGDLMPEDGVTRYQAALFFAQILTGKTDAAVWNKKAKSDYYTDVVEYADAIDLLTEQGKIRGIGGGRFGYNAGILYRDMLVLAVRFLGEETEGMTYPADYIARAEALGLCENLALAPDGALRRGETAQLMYNLLLQKPVPRDESKTLLETFEELRDAEAPTLPPAPVPTPDTPTVDAATGNDKTYMIALPDYTVEIESDTKYKYRLTVSGLYDLCAGARVKPFSIVTDDLADNKLYKAKPGALVYYNGNHRVTVCENLCTDETNANVKARFADLYELIRDNKDGVWIDAADFRMPSEDTVVCTALDLDGVSAMAEMNIRLTTVDLTDLDKSDYDFDGAYLARPYDAANGFDAGTVSVDGKDYYTYPLPATAEVVTEEIHAPGADLFDDFILATAGQSIRIPKKGDGDAFAQAHVNLYIVGSVKRGVLDLAVWKLIVAE